MQRCRNKKTRIIDGNHCAHSRGAGFVAATAPALARVTVRVTAGSLRRAHRTPAGSTLSLLTSVLPGSLHRAQAVSRLLGRRASSLTRAQVAAASAAQTLTLALMPLVNRHIPQQAFCLRAQQMLLFRGPPPQQLPQALALMQRAAAAEAVAALRLQLQQATKGPQRVER